MNSALSRRAKSRKGFTRTGVAVSAVSIGLLLMLLFPYLLQSRASARRELCRLNLTQIGLALAHYGEDFQSLPYGTLQNLELPPQKRLSWYPQVWEYMASNAVQLPVARDEPWDSQHNLTLRAYLGTSEPEVSEIPENATDTPLLVCPSMPFERPQDAPGPTSYIGIAGVGTDAAELAVTDQGAGIWGYDRCTPLEMLPRGSGSLLLLAETGHETGPWTAGGTPTLRGLDPDSRQLIGTPGPLGGNHPRGANVVMADYSTQFLTTDTDTRLLTQLATMHSSVPASNNRAPKNTTADDRAPKDAVLQELTE